MVPAPTVLAKKKLMALTILRDLASCLSLTLYCITRDEVNTQRAVMQNIHVPGTKVREMQIFITSAAC